MPNVSEINQELVRAFNTSLCKNDIVMTNLTVQNLHRNFHKEDHIVISFDKSMGADQCMKYLNDMKEKIVEEFCEDESSASMSFNISFFPFKFSKKQLNKDSKGRYKFSVPIDKDVIFNLKCCLAHVLAKDIKVNIGHEFGIGYAEENTGYVSFDRKSYLYCMRFNDWKLKVRFINLLSSKITGYGNAPIDYLEIIDNRVYIEKSIFDNVEFIKNIVKDKASLVCRDFEIPSAEDEVVESLKFSIIDFIRRVGIPVNFVLRSSYLGNHENSILVPIAKGGNVDRFLTRKEVNNINNIFDINILRDIEDCTSPQHLPVYGNKGMYGIDFADQEISYCVLNKIMENSVINKDHELSIDPELRFQALLRSPSTETQSPEASPVFPTFSPKELEGSPRQGSKKEEVLYNHVDVPGTSGASWPSSSLRSVSSAQNVPAAQPQGRCSLPPPPPLIQISSNVSGSHPPTPSGTLLWKSNPVGDNLWTQNLCSLLPPPPLISSSSNVSGSQPPAQMSSSGASSSKGANPVEANPCLSQSTSGNKRILSMQFTKPGPIDSLKGAQAGANISKKEEKLIKALLYTLNLTNYTCGGVYTNFFAKDGKIVSCLHDNVDREKYFQAVRNYIIKEYYEDEKEASKVCDLDEFPFKLNCEEKQETTVVANISSGALSNLKILFSQKFGKSVDAIDISAVKKVEEREKDEWVDRQLFNKDSLEEACEDCFPDEEAMKIIPIAFEEGEYVLDRSRDTCEVKLLLREQLRRFRGTSVAGKGESDDKPLTEEEKEFFKALLYAFNYSNKNFDLPDTNFIVKNEKIVSLINDDVDVKEYLKEVRDDTIKGYYVNEKEAYYLNEFPFKFLSNCEKNQETTVVANISRGALFNLKKIFISCYGGKMEEIDTNIVKEAVKSGKHRLVELKERGIEREAGYRARIKRREAVTACYPDEGALEDIPIGKYEAGYYLDRTCDDWETESFAKQYCAEGTSVAGKVKPEDNKDSGYYSGFVTDAENVSSKAEATTSGYESMDCENNRGGSPKRKSQSPEDGGIPKKSLRRDSSPLSRLESLSLSSSSHQIGKC